MEDIRQNSEQLEEKAEAQGETHKMEKADPPSLPAVISMPILFNDEPEGIETKPEGTETKPDSVKGSLVKEALPNEALASIENTDKKHVKTSKTSKTTKKSSVVRAPNKVRGNRLLRKTIQPRNAEKALTGLKGIEIEEFVSREDNGKTQAFIVVNGVQYVAHGRTKRSAKNWACEKALSDFMSHKLKAKPLEGGQDDPGNDKSILSLASYALHKLFGDWKHKNLPIPTVLLPGKQNTI